MTPASDERRLLPSVVALGATTLVTQTVVLRSFLTVFYGNELVIGVVLACWMILTGAGAWLAGHAGHRWFRGRCGLVALQLLLGFLPAATVFLLFILRNLVFPQGTMIGLVESLYSALILLAPFCLLSGALFTMYAGIIMEERNSSRIARVYGFEAAGSVAGGIIFSIFAVRFLSTFQTLLLVAALNIAVSAFLVRGGRQRTAARAAWVLLGLAVLVACAGWFAHLDMVTRQMLFPGQQILQFSDTPYGNVTITQQGEQQNVYENSVLLCSTHDVISNEEAAHYAMVQRPHAKNVVLVSGGITGMTDEILKYKVQRVDVVEINPWLIDAGRLYTPALRDERVHAIAADARRYFRGANELYGVAIMNVGDPGTAQANRYYTVEFLKDVKRALAPGGVVSLSLLPATEYMGGEARQASSAIFATLQAVFAHVLIVPGMKNYFLASDGPLRIDVAKLTDSLAIGTAYVNSYYVDDRQLDVRSKAIGAALDTAAILNYDFAPVAYIRQVRYWLSYFPFNFRIVGAVCILVLAVLLVRMNAVSLGMFVSGAAGSSIEVVLLLSFQVLYGSVYLATGMIITAFMAGMAGGSLYVFRRRRYAEQSVFAGVQAGVGGYALILPLVLIALKNGQPGDGFVYVVFMFMTACIGCFVGLEFRAASGLLTGSSGCGAGKLYSVDLLGSAVGALLVSVLLLPWLGIIWVCVLIASVSLASAANTQIRLAAAGQAVVQKG